VGFQKTAPTFRLDRACIAGEQLLWGEAGVVAGIGGKDATPVWVAAGLTGGNPHGEYPFERMHDLVRGRT
jgi:hypothetical protein